MAEHNVLRKYNDGNFTFLVNPYTALVASPRRFIVLHNTLKQVLWYYLIQSASILNQCKRLLNY